MGSIVNSLPPLPLIVRTGDQVIVIGKPPCKEVLGIRC